MPKSSKAEIDRLKAAIRALGGPEDETRAVLDIVDIVCETLAEEHGFGLGGAVPEDAESRREQWGSWGKPTNEAS